MASSSILFTPFKLGPFVLRNRIVLAPLTRGRATEKHIPTQIMQTHYVQRADAGLLIAEAAGISPQGTGWYRAPGIWNEEQVIEWRKIVDAVHKLNGIIALQLWHQGRQAHSDVTGQQIVSSSSIGLKGNVTTNKGIKKPHQTPKELDKNEINQIINDYGNAAVNAIKAGFDLIEVHGANGYLIDQFLQSICNKRNDEYGGTIEKRLLFMKQIINKLLSKGIENYRIGIRISPNGTYGGMGCADNIELFSKAIEWLTYKNIGYIHLMDGLTFTQFLPFHNLTKPFTLKMGKDIIDDINRNKDKNDKNTVYTALMGNVGYTKESAEKAIASGDGDLIAFGRDYMSNPDLVYRFENNLKLAPVAELKYWFGWNMNEEGYNDWPTAKDKTKISKL